MRKTLEDSMQEILESMLGVCLEYADDRADGVYLWGAAEAGMSSADVFYEINGDFYLTHQLHTSASTASAAVLDTFEDRSSALLACLLGDFEQLVEVHEQHDREPPTEMKAHYDVTREKLSVAYCYDLRFSNSETLTPGQNFDAWYEEVRWQRPRAG